MKKIKILEYVVVYGLIWMLLGWLFYRELWISVFFVVVCTPIFVYRQQKIYANTQKRLLEEQFKDCIVSLAASLRTGYSPENAWVEARREMVFLHGDKSIIVKETDSIIHRLKIKQPLETILEDFGERSGIEDIKNFAEVFGTAKRSGGDLVAIISYTAKTISDKADVQREIRTIIAAKRLEQRIMILMPLAILLYMGVFSDGFLDVLYEGVTGRVVMTVCFAVYLAAFFLGEKIVETNI